MPYLCRVTISGPEPDANGVSQMMDAVATAIESGWDAPRVFADEDDDTGIPDEPPDDDSPDGAILDYRVLGYPGGAIILVVLDDGDLMQTSVGITGLAQHLTTWSPGLMEYSPDEISISKVDKPYDGENWLQPVGEDDEGDSERPRWHLAELLDDGLQEMATGYLLARAVRSLWDPTDPVESHRARDIVLGAVEDPWGRELVSALGVLLVQAARIESDSGAFASLVVQGAGAPELAADLLRRARETGPEAETDGWTDDDMRGHVLVAGFTEAHQLLWNRVLDDESPQEYEDRSNRQLRTVLWAGLRALATMADTLRQLSGPWQFLDALCDDAAISILAENEQEQNEENTEEDQGEIEAAAAAHVLVWLAIQHPELLGAPASESMVEQVNEDVSAFHQVFYATMLMAGSGPLNAALAENPAPAQLRADIADFAAALSATASHRPDDLGESYDDMHGALELVLDEEADLRDVIRYLLAITSLAARFTGTDANPNRALEGHVSTPGMLTHYLLVEPAMHAALVLHRHDDDNAVRTRMLSLAAHVAPAAAGAMAAEFPGLTGEDPRLEPASRLRARHWIEHALRRADERERGAAVAAGLNCTADARTVVRAVRAGQDLPASWPVDRLISASAEAASAVLHCAGITELAEEVFAET
jgi:hypothetical protein